MSRKILVSLFIIFVACLLLYRLTSKSRDISSDDFASRTEAQPEKKLFNPENKNKPVENNLPSTHSINSASSTQTGKYSLRNLKPMAEAESLQNEIAKRDLYLRNNNAGLVLKSADQNFVLMKFRASKDKLNSANDKSLGHDFFSIDSQLAKKVIVDEDSYPVVYRESNGRMGLLTGVILIQFQTQDRTSADKLALKYPIDLQLYDSSIELASYKVRDGEGLYDIFNSIKQNERVRSITVEVLDSYKGF